MANSGLPLNTLAKSILARMGKADDMLISAGRELMEARARVAAGEAGEDVDWKRWLAIHQIGEEKAKVCLRIAQDPDPEQALADHREKQAGRKRKERSKAEPTGCDVTSDQSERVTGSTYDPTAANTNEPTAPPLSKVEQVLSIWATMTADERLACMEAQRNDPVFRAEQLARHAARAVAEMKKRLMQWAAVSPKHRPFDQISYEHKRQTAFAECPTEEFSNKVVMAAIDQALADAGEIEDLVPIRETALHEAGHALAAAFYGHAIKFVEVRERSDRDGALKHGETIQEAMRRSPDYFMEDCIIDAAGPMAADPQIRTFTEFEAAAKASGGRGDLKQFIASAHDAVLVHRTNDIEAFQEEAVAATRALLDRPASQQFLDRMVETLIEKRRLNGKEVMVIYQEAIDAPANDTDAELLAAD